MCEGWESERVMISKFFFFLFVDRTGGRAGGVLLVCVCMGLFCHNLIGKEKEENRKKKLKGGFFAK